MNSNDRPTDPAPTAPPDKPDAPLTKKELGVLIGNGVIAAIAIIAFAKDMLSAEMLALVLAATGFPSAVGILTNKIRKAPPSVDGGATVLLLFALATMSVGAGAIGCAALASTERANRYFLELADCNAEASTKRASIECENDVRRRYPLPDGAPRPLRDAGAAF